ncbi:diacylglycerol/lipid kinase family protein [Sphingomonas flavescens]|uniref:diacylglycerol/lipid kinase family protein n=1 Tax=Sphingomonas flavescens TaxID=3132797 RepID=UPI00280396F1|nr:diacylglycerol kinase family protein [Sphingomonas limnosediminicola]
MTAVSILVNKGGGAASRDPAIKSNVAKAFKAAGMDVKVELIDGGKCEARAKALAKRGDKLVVVGGGDGTISAAASGLLGSKTALGVLPLGTLNHFARDLGIPTKLEEAAALIAKGKPRQVDVAEMNGRIFINNSAIGLYPLMVLDRETQQKRLGRSKRLAMIVASARTLARFNHQRLTLTVNDEKAQIDTPLLFVGNNDYRLDIGGPGKRESVEDGRLSVFVMRKKTRRGLIAAMVRVLFNRARPDDMVQLENVQRLRVASRRSSLAVSLDGEVVGAKPPLDYKVRAKALRVIAP